MTREEAINQLQDAKDGYKEYLSNEALDMAIKALEQESITKNDLADDCISREQAIKEADYLSLETSYDNQKVIEMLETLPPATPIRPKGHWIPVYPPTDPVDDQKCSECGNIYPGATRYCPDCGAKMFES